MLGCADISFATLHEIYCVIFALCAILIEQNIAK
jgi:hypothetical protein